MPPRSIGTEKAASARRTLWIYLASEVHCQARVRTEMPRPCAMADGQGARSRYAGTSVCAYQQPSSAWCSTNQSARRRNRCWSSSRAERSQVWKIASAYWPIVIG